MTTRRQTIIGLAAAATGGAVLSAGAFTSSVSAEADMRVVVVSDLRLLAAREEGDYVDADEIDDPIGEFIIRELNKNAFTDFGNLAKIVNEGTITYDELRFKFEEDDDEEGEDDAVVNALGIVSEKDVETEEDDDIFTITPEDGLEPGDEIEFGIAVDLLPSSDREIPDLSEGVDVVLEITAVSDDNS